MPNRKPKPHELEHFGQTKEQGQAALDKAQAKRDRKAAARIAKR